MPYMQKHHQDSGNSGKAEYIVGHNFGQISAIITNGEVSHTGRRFCYYARPLFLFCKIEHLGKSMPVQISPSLMVPLWAVMVNARVV